MNSSELLSLEEDIFQYAKKNLAVVNVYIKARDFVAHLYYLQHKISALPLIRLSCQSTLMSRELGDAHYPGTYLKKNAKILVKQS